MVKQFGIMIGLNIVDKTGEGYKKFDLFSLKIFNINIFQLRYHTNGRDTAYMVIFLGLSVFLTEQILEE